MTTTEQINEMILTSVYDTNKISDGYHTFGELYEHRIQLFMTLCSLAKGSEEIYDMVWRSKKHCDGSIIDGWFILGIGEYKGRQITYHLPMSKWDETGYFATTIEQAPEYDGHTSDDVLKRLKALY